MKKNLVVLLVVLLVALVFCANVVFAQNAPTATVTDVRSNANTNTDVDNNLSNNQTEWQTSHNENNLNTTGGAASLNYKSLRNVPGFISPWANFVNPSGTAVGSWEMVMKCQQVTFPELEQMTDSIFWLRSGVKSYSRIKKAAKYDESGFAQILGYMPNEPQIAEYRYSGGEEGEPYEISAARLILLAWKDLNARKVVVLVRTDLVDMTKSSTVGIASGGSGILKGSDTAAGVTLGFSKSKSIAKSDEVYSVRILVYEGNTTPPDGVDPCGQKIVKTPPPVISTTTTTVPPTPVPTPVVPAPAPKPQAKKTPCESGCCTILRKIVELDEAIAKCYPWCLNNLRLRTDAGHAAIEAWKCTGDRNYLESAVYHFSRAELNYRHGGDDIKQHQTEADKLLYQAYYSWSGVVYQLHGEGAAKAFAIQKGLERIPGGYARK